jgi:hypothetical protein
MTSTQKKKAQCSGLNRLSAIQTNEKPQTSTYNAAGPSLSPADRILKIADLKGTIRQLEDALKNEVDKLQGEIELGLLEELEEEGSYHYGGVRCTPYETKRWSYPDEVKDAIKELQERAIYQGSATQKVTKSVRITL